jgi:hypothetical protein
MAGAWLASVCHASGLWGMLGGLGVRRCVRRGPGEHHPPNEPLTFGELVFRVIRTNLAAAQTCSLEYVSQLEPHHADFVRSFGGEHRDLADGPFDADRSRAR